ncbi:antirepressor AbbA [Sutcliffiella halmapala]|uniref:antirepressor AbbA n=1 Tax=Sutcliffiella halmapala TaxID=79882 RepID=UPI0009949199|nr:antirepressor AbbA [Sutcliffiella halmapala]
MVSFTEEEKELLVSLLISTNFAKELVVNEINDIEIGEKKLESNTYIKLVQLYDKISS